MTNKIVGLVVVPMEFARDNRIPPDSVKERLRLPDGVKVMQMYEDIYRMSIAYIVTSDEEVPDVTFQTAPGCLIPYSKVTIKECAVHVG